MLDLLAGYHLSECMQRNDGGETVEEGTVYLFVSSCLVDDQLVD